MKPWGRYELVSAPGDADLVFQIRPAVIQLQREQVFAASDSVLYDPQMILVIRDAKYHETPWGLTVNMRVAVLQSNRDKNFGQALARLICRREKNCRNRG